MGVEMGNSLRQNSDRDPELRDCLFVNNSVRFIELLASDPEGISGLSQYKDCRFVALDSMTGNVVFGSQEYDAVGDRLSKAAGEDFSLRYQIVELAPAKP